MARTILFAEVPGFYAAVERADDPALASRPVIVGGDPRKRGRVQSATPDALRAGVCAEMPMLEALQRCPRARAVRTDMARYRQISRRLLAALRRVHPQLEPFGLAAAYADLSGVGAAADSVAEALREVVRSEFGLPLRVGIASSKFLARLAAEEVAEDGIRCIGSGDEAAFLAPLEVTRLEGVGRKTAATLAAAGVHRIGDVVALGRAGLEQMFGGHGIRIHACATGQDREPVRASRHPGSISRESTVRAEALDLVVLLEQLSGLAQQLEEELRRQGLAAGKLTLKLRFADQRTESRSRTLSVALSPGAEILAAAELLLRRTQAGTRSVRRIGLQLSGLLPAGAADRQLDLFPHRS